MSEQRRIGVARPLLEKIVRMRDEADEPMSLLDQRDLALPEVNGVLIQDMEQ
jgi:hypothetical protein